MPAPGHSNHEAEPAEVSKWTRRGVVMGMCAVAAGALALGERLLFPESRWLGEPPAPEPTAAERVAQLAAGSDEELWASAEVFLWLAVNHPEERGARSGIERLASLAMVAQDEVLADDVMRRVVAVLTSWRDEESLRHLAERVFAGTGSRAVGEPGAGSRPLPRSQRLLDRWRRSR